MTKAERIERNHLADAISSLGQAMAGRDGSNRSVDAAMAMRDWRESQIDTVQLANRLVQIAEA